MYGYGVGAIEVQVEGTDGSGSAVSYTVSTVADANHTWKVLLHPAQQGGKYTITAKTASKSQTGCGHRSVFLSLSITS